MGFPNFLFVLTDLTSSATPDALRVGPVLQAMADAWAEQLTAQFGPAYGLPSFAFRIASGPGDKNPGELGINFRDNLPGAPGALAYHDVVNGVADIEIGVDLFETLTTGNESVSQGGSHEILELLEDTGANQWAELQNGSGLMVAKESCDVVQNTAYGTSHNVQVSNFLLPSYFVPGCPGPWDYLGVMKSQNDISNGYEIQAGAPTDVTQTQLRGLNVHHGRVVSVRGELTEKQAKRKSHPWSRTYRRGVRL